jgi:hypothetical protein
MKKDAAMALEIVRAIAKETNQPEGRVLAAYDEATSALKHDARILDYVPLLAARRVRETMRTSIPTPAPTPTPAPAARETA